jgi:hypothetical protein
MLVVTTLTTACNGLSNGAIAMAITGAAGPFTWSWTRSGGGTGSGTGTSITALTAGTYTVIVTAGNGAGSSKTFTVTVASNPAISALAITPANVLCNALTTGSITVANPVGGTPPFTYLWNDAVTTQNRSSLAAGNYSVTATDANGCTAASGTITITQPAAIAITPTVTNVSCNGNTTGAISLAVTGGTGTLTYAWNDGATTQNRINLAAGTYSVIVTDVNNCTKTQTGMVVTQPAAALSLSATSVNVACYGNSTGSINLSATGGTTPYGYDWGGSISTEDRTTLTAGNYSVTVTDANGCTAVLSKTITQPVALSLSTVQTHETCPGAFDGAITLTVSGGTTTYSFVWTGPSSFTSTSQSLTALKGGAYSVTVTDANSCTSILSVTVNTTGVNPEAPATINH